MYLWSISNNLYFSKTSQSNAIGERHELRGFSLEA